MVRFPSTDGAEVAAYDFGGDGPPLLFAHATGFHAHIWEPIVTRVAGGFHCYGFDARGHGDSSDLDGLDYDWHGFADDSLAAVDGLGLTRPFAVGHSSGGAALIMAEEARPATFRAIYCYEPIILPFEHSREPTDNPLSQAAAQRREVFPSRDAAYEHYSGRGNFARLHPDALRAYVDHGFDDLPDGQVRLKCRGAHEGAMYRVQFSHDAFEGMSDIACPLHLVAGSATDSIHSALVEAQAAAAPRATTEVLDGLGHFGPLEDPDAVADSILRAFAGA